MDSKRCLSGQAGRAPVQVFLIKQDNLKPINHMHGVRVNRKRYWHIWEIFLLGSILFWASLVDSDIAKWWVHLLLSC